MSRSFKKIEINQALQLLHAGLNLERWIHQSGLNETKEADLRGLLDDFVSTLNDSKDIVVFGKSTKSKESFVEEEHLNQLVDSIGNVSANDVLDFSIFSSMDQQVDDVLNSQLSEDEDVSEDEVTNYEFMHMATPDIDFDKAVPELPENDWGIGTLDDINEQQSNPEALEIALEKQGYNEPDALTEDVIGESDEEVLENEKIYEQSAEELSVVDVINNVTGYQNEVDGEEIASKVFDENNMLVEDEPSQDDVLADNDESEQADFVDSLSDFAEDDSEDDMHDDLPFPIWTEDADSE